VKVENALEIAIISVLGGIVAALIAVGGAGFFWLSSRIDRLAEQNNATHNELNEKIDQTNRELSEKIDQTHRELSEKIDQTHRELDEKIDQRHQELNEKIDRLHEDMMQQMAQMKTEIINALVNHSHPEPGGPPVFTVPPPIVPPDPTARETEATPADD